MTKHTLKILRCEHVGNVSNTLDPIVFPDDTNVISDKNVNSLSTSANLELQKMNEWFKANKLSLNTKKLFSVYYESTQKGNLPLAVPILRRDGVGLKRKPSITFLRVLLNESLTWKDHINTIENKFSKNIGLIFGAKNVLNKDSLMKLYYSYVLYYSITTIWHGVVPIKQSGIIYT